MCHRARRRFDRNALGAIPQSGRDGASGQVRICSEVSGVSGFTLRSPVSKWNSEEPAGQTSPPHPQRSVQVFQLMSPAPGMSPECSVGQKRPVAPTNPGPGNDLPDGEVLIILVISTAVLREETREQTPGGKSHESRARALFPRCGRSRPATRKSAPISNEGQSPVRAKKASAQARTSSSVRSGSSPRCWRSAATSALDMPNQWLCASLAFLWRCWLIS